jgi:uncharacterized protein DUF6378
MDTSELLLIRGQTHGDFTSHAEIAMGLKEVMEDQPNWKRLSNVQKQALHMIQDKIGRILAGNPDHKDHWDDIAGYAKLVSDRL